MASTAFPSRDDFAALLNDSLGGEDGGFYMLGLGKHINHPDIPNLVSIKAFQVAGQGGRIARNINDLFRLGF